MRRFQRTAGRLPMLAEQTVPDAQAVQFFADRAGESQKKNDIGHRVLNRNRKRRADQGEVARKREPSAHPECRPKIHDERVKETREDAVDA